MNEQHQQKRCTARHCTEQTISKTDSMAGRYCRRHYAAMRRRGTTEETTRPRARISPSGYVKLRLPNHPIADANGDAYEHRVVLYSILGPGQHQCEHCRELVSWEERTLEVDHLDFNRQNNTPANLIPSCHGCNVRRSADAGRYRGPLGLPDDAAPSTYQGGRPSTFTDGDPLGRQTSNYSLAVLA